MIAAKAIKDTTSQQRDTERERYLAANHFSMEEARERWRRYEKLILTKYDGEDLAKAWHARDRAR